MRAVYLMILLAVFAFAIPANAQVVDHSDGNVEWIQTGDPARNCFFFTLVGVNEAHPVVPGGRWFAVPSNSSRAKEMLNNVTVAKALELRLDVRTTGAVQCGFAEADFARLK